jgi:hypothetical protein
MSNKNRPSMPSTPFGGDDCDRPACDDVKDAMAKSGLLTTLEPSRSRQPIFASSQKLDCPVNTAQLGQSSWTLLHTMVRQSDWERIMRCLCVFVLYIVISMYSVTFFVGRLVPWQAIKRRSNHDDSLCQCLGKILPMSTLCTGLSRQY